MLKEIFSKIKKEFDDIPEQRMAVFIVLYLLFSLIKAQNIAHLLAFCYTIFLLEKLIKNEKNL